MSQSGKVNDPVDRELQHSSKFARSLSRDYRSQNHAYAINDKNMLSFFLEILHAMFKIFITIQTKPKEKSEISIQLQ